jgi:hypothetical protein
VEMCTQDYCVNSTFASDKLESDEIL